MDSGVVSGVVAGLFAEAKGDRVYEPNQREDTMKMLHPDKSQEDQDMARALMFAQSKLAKLRNEEAAQRRALEKTGKCHPAHALVL